MISSNFSKSIIKQKCTVHCMLEGRRLKVVECCCFNLIRSSDSNSETSERTGAKTEGIRSQGFCQGARQMESYMRSVFWIRPWQWTAPHRLPKTWGMVGSLLSFFWILRMQKGQESGPLGLRISLGWMNDTAVLKLTSCLRECSKICS